MENNNLDSIYYKKYGKHLFDGVYESRDIRLKDDLISLYQIRNENYKAKKGKDNFVFQNFINELKAFPEKYLLTHTNKTEEYMHVLYTDVKVASVAGELFTKFIKNDV